MIPMVKAHSHDMRLTRVGAADGCVAAEIGNLAHLLTSKCRVIESFQESGVVDQLDQSENTHLIRKGKYHCTVVPV